MKPSTLPGNSTNVRTITQRAAPSPQVGTRAIGLGTFSLLAAALAAWCAFVGALAAAGVFARVGPAASAAALAFACAYAFGLAALDPEIRDQVARLPRGALGAFALAADAAIVIAGVGVDDGPRIAEWLMQFAHSWTAGTLAPLAAMAHAAVLRPARLSSAAATSPGGSPAAT